MKNRSYEELLLRKCVEIYERRKYYTKQEGDRRSAIFVKIQDIFLTYRDPFEYKRYRDIHRAVLRLIQEGILSGIPDEQGYFDKLRFFDEKIGECYERLGITSAQEMSEKMRRLIDRYDREDYPMLHTFCEAQRGCLEAHTKLSYGLDQNEEKMEDVLRALTMMEGLEEEMTVRDFSEELFGDPEWFSQIRLSLQHILYDGLQPIVERDRVLEWFHLVDRPTYFHIKGAAMIQGRGSAVNVERIPEGIAIGTQAIKEIEEISVFENVVVVTDDESVFHETKANGRVVIYPGGVMTRERTALLRKIYESNPELTYGYKGNIDVYGFLTYEWLREQTGIPFLPFEMDLMTLQKYRRARKCREMNAAEKRLLGADVLEAHREVLEYMNEHDCKLEWRRVYT
ncbi:MAG: hypothetical protein IKU83_06395 [Lachnospiraceae bacterium]|nr:hypothetical protein [Lachnospiraceae bacterium]